MAQNSNTFSSWFNNIKSDDIDDGLAADFDGSLSGLGVELGSTTYNMSEALLALPVFKQETFEHGLKKLVEESRALIKENGNDPDTLPRNASPLESSSVPPVFSLRSERFQYILGASTSPATKVNEETLTYLNQGQSYEVKLKRLGQLGDLRGKLLKSKVRVVFHERRLQYTEREQLDTWKLTRPGERILDIDIPLSYGITDVVVDQTRLNTLEFVWDPTKEVGVYCKVNCISTEFTAKKHGGEKGVPFRLQVETYTMDSDNSVKLLHCGSCQIKVFKPKGADRKNKTDREKIEKRSPADKEKYQPSYECTVLTEIPTDQVENYLDQLKKQDQIAEENAKNAPPKKTVTVMKTETKSPVASPDSKCGEDSLVRNFACLSDSSNMSSESIPTPDPWKKPVKRTIKYSGSSPNLTTPTRITNPNPPKPSQEKTLEPLLVTASAKEVTQWLQANRFNTFIRVFQNFSGADLLRLSREDLIQICGLADGIRLNNALQAKALRPKLTLYVCQMTGKHRNQQQSEQSSTPSPSTSPLTRSAISPAHFIPPHRQPDYPSYRVIEGLMAAVASSGVSDRSVSSQSSSSTTAPVAIPVVHTTSGNTSPILVQSAPGKFTIVTTDSRITPVVTSDDGTPSIPNKSPKSSTSSTKLYTSQSSKRQYRESNDDEEDEEEMFYSKKQRTRNLELSRKGVYHALYMDHLTYCDLQEKTAALFSIEPIQIKEIYVQGPSRIHIMVTDEVVQNFVDETRYFIEVIQDEDSTGVSPEYFVYFKSSLLQ